MAEKLGFDSVDDMESAIDAMEGIADDGGKIEADSMAREARVRSAYLDWCKEYGKEQDESRFKVFYDNFLVMEKFAKESGKEMSLNMYADCTEEEYKAATQAEQATEKAEAKAKEDEAKKKEQAAAKAAADKKAEEQAAAKAEKEKKVAAEKADKEKAAKKAKDEADKKKAKAAGKYSI